MRICPPPFKQKHSKTEAIAHLISLRCNDGAFTVQACDYPSSPPTFRPASTSCR